MKNFSNGRNSVAYSLPSSAVLLYWPILNLKKKQLWFKILVTENGGSSVSFLLLLIYLLTGEQLFSFSVLIIRFSIHYFTEWKFSNKYIGVEPLRTYFKIPNTLFTTLMVRCHVLYVWCFLLLVHFQHWKKVLLRPNYSISSPYQHSLIIWFFHNTNIL